MVGKMRIRIYIKKSQTFLKAAKETEVLENHDLPSPELKRVIRVDKKYVVDLNSIWEIGPFYVSTIFVYVPTAEYTDEKFEIFNSTRYNIRLQYKSQEKSV